MKSLLQYSLLAIVLVLAQVVLSKVILFNVAVPFVFIYLVLHLPAGLGRNIVYTIAFFTGLLIDIFNNTPGMNALACVVMAALRLPVLRLTAPRDVDPATITPSMATLGPGGFFRYVTVPVVIYCVIVFFVQAFTLRDVLLTVARAAASSALSIVLIVAIDSLVSTRREKRL